jgi:hypothetical protein
MAIPTRRRAILGWYQCRGASGAKELSPADAADAADEMVTANLDPAFGYR